MEVYRSGHNSWRTASRSPLHQLNQKLMEVYRSGHNGPHSKCGNGVTRSWVRIPPLPPSPATRWGFYYAEARNFKAVIQSCHGRAVRTHSFVADASLLRFDFVLLRIPPLPPSPATRWGFYYAEARNFKAVIQSCHGRAVRTHSFVADASLLRFDFVLLRIPPLPPSPATRWGFYYAEARNFKAVIQSCLTARFYIYIDK